MLKFPPLSPQDAVGRTTRGVGSVLLPGYNSALLKNPAFAQMQWAGLLVVASALFSCLGMSSAFSGAAPNSLAGINPRVGTEREGGYRGHNKNTWRSKKQT